MASSERGALSITGALTPLGRVVPDQNARAAYTPAANPSEPPMASATITWGNTALVAAAAAGAG
ncbi:MAG TPA: hypothetical protein VMG12_43085 [Polyangiaceae bacterium]|nr:hypothetical protein [Polyangiaceae bacterium]